MNKIGFFPGVWDLLHPGHISSLWWAMNYDFSSKFIVGLQSSPHLKKPTETLAERWIRLWPLTKNIIPYETEEDLRNLVIYLKPCYYFLGEEYEYKEDVCCYDIRKKLGLTYVYVPRIHDWSSTNLKKRIRDGE